MSFQNELRQKINEKIIAALSTGGLPIWRKNWSGLTNLPTNIVSMKPYRGINPLILAMHQLEHSLSSPFYATYKQWNQQFSAQVLPRPSNVISGSWGAGIIYSTTIYKDIENSKSGKMEQQRFQVLQNYVVFSLDQISGGKNLDKYRMPSNTLGRECVNFQPAKDFIESLKLSQKLDVRYGGDRAYYSPSGDYIQLPYKQDFEGENENEKENLFLATAFHEILHWAFARK